MKTKKELGFRVLGAKESCEVCSFSTVSYIGREGKRAWCRLMGFDAHTFTSNADRFVCDEFKPYGKTRTR